MSRKVFVIAPQPFFAPRGTPMNVRALVETMAKAGADIHLLVYPCGEPITIPGVTIHRSLGVPGINDVPVGASWRKLLLDIPFCFSALLIALRHRFDVYHGIEEGGFVAGFLGLLLRRSYVYDMDSCMVDQLRTGRFGKIPLVLPLVGVMERFFMRRATAILTVSTPLSRKAEAIAPSVPVHQVEDFPLESVGTINQPLLEELRAKFRPNGEPLLLYTGNLEYYQGVELALAAWQAMQKTNGGTAPGTFLLVGGTSAQIDKLRSLANELRISESVVFTGPRPPEDMGTYLELASALVSPRIVGGNTPLKLFTYMASGKPLAATRISAHLHVLDDSTAFLAEPDAADLGKALALALTHDSRTERAARASELVANRYSRKNFEERLERLYEFLLPSGRLSSASSEGEIRARRAI